jgi:pyridoxal 5'-phosphate synthase pdxT subunit
LVSRPDAPRVGVLALQGDTREHLRMLQECGVRAHAVRRPAELEGLDGLVLPGGESTTMAKLARTFDLLEPLRSAVTSGLPVFGTCAGMILLADRIEDGAAGQETIGGLDVVVRRNAFGRQVDSFEAELEVTPLHGSFHAVFIRAPWVESVGDGVEVVARVATAPVRAHGPAARSAAGRIVGVRQGHLLATSFHPEVTGDRRIHDYFVTMVRET